MFEPIDVIGYLAMVLLWTGLYLVTQKKRLGWISGILGCVLFMGYAVILGLVPIFITNMVFCSINIRGYFKWRHLDEMDYRGL